jgi:hypothetical protein
MDKQRALRGYTFRSPKGKLDWRIEPSVSRAQDNAAFASDRPYSHISMPSDWDRAYKQGFRIVSATLSVGASHPAWKKARPD